MKRLKSSDDLSSYGGEKGVFKDWGRKDDDSGLHKSSLYKSFHCKSEIGKKGLSSSSSSRYHRAEDDSKNSRLIRKRPDYDVDSYERRKSYDRYVSDRVHRSESFSGPRRDFPKGFRSERDRREGSVSSWQRFSGGKEAEEGGAKSGGDSAKESKTVSEEIGNVRSKSPDWSKSIEVKKSESQPAESGNNSEREAGELEPDPDLEFHPESAQIVEETAVGSSSDPEISIDNKCLVSKEEIKPEKVCVLAEKADDEEQENLQNVMNTGNNNKSSSSEDSCTQKTGENEVAVPLLSDNEMKDATKEGMDVSRSFIPVEIKSEQENDANIEIKEENKKVNNSLVTKELTQNFKDKGKSVIVSVSSGNDETSGFLNSTRGFDLFFMDPIKKPDFSDQKDEKLSLEPLELSLRLPTVLLPIGAHQPISGPDSQSQEMSIQSHASSFQTSSDGFTRSFSGSQNYTHNPSCSLTENSLDFEKSVGSRPLFQGVNWQIQSSDDHKNNEPQLHQITVSNDDDAFKSDNIQISQEKIKQPDIEQSNNTISNSKSSHEATMWMKSIYTDRPTIQLKTTSSDMPRVTPREPVLDELDGIIKIKLAEAQMFQTRADDARREAEGLNRIAQAKSKKIDEEFRNRVRKLRLSEAEEIRRQKLEELRVLESAHQEYFNMKVRMEREIKDLLIKMEATKRNFSSL